MKLTKENYENYLALKEAFEEKILKVLEEKCIIETGRTYLGDEVIKIEYNGEAIEILTEIYSNCSCCSDEYMEYTFPKSYLFRDDWKEEVKEEIRKEREFQEFLKEEKEKKKKEAQEERERKEFERLKMKFDTKYEKKD